MTGAAEAKATNVYTSKMHDKLYVVNGAIIHMLFVVQPSQELQFCRVVSTRMQIFVVNDGRLQEYCVIELQEGHPGAVMLACNMANA